MPGAIFTKAKDSIAFTPLTLRLPSQPFTSHQLQDDFELIPADILDLDLPSLSTKRTFTYDHSSYPDLPSKKSKKTAEPKEPSVVERRAFIIIIIECWIKTHFIFQIEWIDLELLQL